MRKFIQNKLKEQKGLTLIELLAVIVILAIIAAIAIPAIGNIIGNSRVGAIKSDAQNVFSAADLYLIDNPNALDSSGTITQDELVDDGFLDDLGGFEGAATDLVVEANATGDLILTGTGAVGGVSIAFADATRQHVADLPNSTDDAGTFPATNPTITVTR